MSYKSHTAGPSRAFDHLYDPIFKTSGCRDVWKANSQALSSSAPIFVLPIFRTMFSELPQQCRNQYVLQQNPLPHHPYNIGGDFDRAGYQYNVIGKDRVLFFENSMSNTRTINLQLANSNDGSFVPEEVEKFRDSSCQTMYRESSAQTSPWMPEAIIRQKTGENLPEIAHVAEFIKCNKHPGLREVEIVQRMRKKRKWESQLPQVHTLEEFEKRRTVLQAFEWEVWMSREQEINDCQKLRMKIVERLLQKREAAEKSTSCDKMSNTEKRILEKKEEELKKIKLKKERQLRKLEMKHQGISKKYQPNDIIDQHMDPGSDLYAPQLRFGKHPRDSHFEKKKTAFTARLQNLEKMSTRPTSSDIERYMQPNPKLTQPKERCDEIHKGFLTDQNLKNLYESLITLRQNANASHKNIPKCLIHISPPKISSTSTPTGELNDETDDLDMKNSITLLQKIIKGRAIQNILYKGRDNCRKLIDELQSTFKMAGIEDDFAVELKKAHLEVQTRNIKFFDEQLIKDTVTAAEGTKAGNMLCFLQNEYERLQGQRKAHALCMLAEKERQHREAGYQGKLQYEQEQARKCSEIHRILGKADNDVVTTYLENILLDGVNKATEDESRQYIQKQAAKLDLKASQTVESDSDDQNETIIEDLLKECVYPLVYKNVQREKIQRKQKAYLLAAHDAVYNHFDTLPIPVERSQQTGEKLAQEIIQSIIDAAVPKSPASSIESLEDVAMQEAESTIKKVLKQILSETEDSDGEDQQLMLNKIVGNINDRLVKFAIDESEVQQEDQGDTDGMGEEEEDETFEQYDGEWFSKTVIIESDDEEIFEELL